MVILLRVFWEIGDAVQIIIKTVIGFVLYPFISLAEWVTHRASSGQLVTTQFSTAVMMILFFLALGTVLLLIRYSYRIAIALGLLTLFNPYVIGFIVCLFVGMILLSRTRKIPLVHPFLKKRQQR